MTKPIIQFIKRNSSDCILGAGLIILGILSRTWLHIAPNVEFVTGISLVAGYFFKNKILAFSVPVITMISTDFIIGNSSIYLFTWSAFFLAPFFGLALQKLLGKDKESLAPISSLGSGVLFTLFFFLWTNYGVVVLGSMYSHNIHGILLSYYNGLPFLRNQLIANLVIVPMLFTLVDLAFDRSHQEKRRLHY